jgi:hypothetical protein
MKTFKIFLNEIEHFIQSSLMFSREMYFNWEYESTVYFNVFRWCYSQVQGILDITK